MPILFASFRFHNIGETDLQYSADLLHIYDRSYAPNNFYNIYSFYGEKIHLIACILIQSPPLSKSQYYNLYKTVSMQKESHQLL